MPKATTVPVSASVLDGLILAKWRLDNRQGDPEVLGEQLGDCVLQLFDELGEKYPKFTERYECLLDELEGEAELDFDTLEIEEGAFMLDDPDA